MNIDQAITYFRTQEGVVPHMYLDTVGLVTVGVGRMLESVADAQTLPFIVRGTKVAAGPGAIGLEWQAVKNLEAGRLASYYEQFTNLELPDAAINTELVKDIEEFSAALRVKFPGLNLYPDHAQLALLDLAYSMGAHELVAGYPKLCAAAEIQDWKTCAAECTRAGVAPSRNEACAALFRAAEPIIPT